MLEIRAIIADDEPLARRGIRQLLASHEDVAVVAETRNGRETVRALRELKPDLVFLDVQMPNLDGFDVVKETASLKAGLPFFYPDSTAPFAIDSSAWNATSTMPR